MIELNLTGFLFGAGLVICIELLLSALFFWVYVKRKNKLKHDGNDFAALLARGFLFLGLAIITAMLLWAFSIYTEYPVSRVFGLLSVGAYMALNLVAAFHIIKGVRLSGS